MLSHKRIHLVILLMLIGSNVFSQAFSEKWSIPLSVHYQSAKAECGDLDNDGLLDIVLLVQSNRSDTCYISIIKGDTINTPVENYSAKFVVRRSDRFYLVDFNSDNMIDIVIPGMNSSVPAKVYLNNGDLSFQGQETNVPSFSKMVFADLDNDAAPEWIVHYAINGSDMVTTFKKENAAWTPVDTLFINAKTLEVLDADGDGFRDLFVSGIVNPDSLFTGFLLNQGNFKYTINSRMDASGNGSMGDVNHDGFFDIVLKGNDKNGNAISKIYLSSGPSYTVRDTLIDSITPSVFIADFNSDGKADMNFWAKELNGDSISLIRNGLSYDTLTLHNIAQEKFGDADHDGDLDALQIQKNNPLTLVLFNNNAPVNWAPGIPSEVRAFSFFDHIFIKYNRSWDDHTPSSAVTYDIYFGGVNPGDFDLILENRLKVNHGNNGARDFLLIKKPEQSTLQFALQPVDNAFHAAGPGPGGSGGICLGGIEICSNMALDSIKMCSREKHVFTSPSNASWYSFSSGYLFTGNSLEYTASSSPDVIFYFMPSNPDCAHLKAWYIDVRDTTRQESFSLFKCEGEEIQLSVEPEWININWKSLKNGPLGTSPTINYTVTTDDRVNALLSTETGCKVDREFIITLSKPKVIVTADNSFVFAGKSVQLHASGTERYLWNSASSIDNVNSSDPLVTPLETTDYTVTGYDSVGCTDQQTIRITVEKNGFIPTLFTPNNDGSNDYLRVYGIFEAEEVSFEIFNRNGSKVFSATSISEMVRGWDGTAHGIKQPGGVYFWKVTGKLFSGEKIQFNGKETGSVVLIR